MRLGVDARLMYHQPAGISRYTLHLLQAMAELDNVDEFTVFQHRKDKVALIRRPNFRRATLYAPAHHWLEQYFLPAELLLFRLDLLHSTDFIPPLYWRGKSVITVHDLAFLHYPYFLTTESAAYYGMIDRAVVRADHIIVPSEHTKQDLIGQMGVPADKVSVIYEAADPSWGPLPLPQTRQAITQKYRIPETYVLFVGTIEPRKNVAGLLQAFARLRDQYGLAGDTGLVIAGSKGWLYDETLETVRTLDLEQRTHFLGRVPDEDLHKLYVGARCHVHPAYYEGFGLPPLEAMACGTPTIVSNVSSLPEVVGDAALLVNPRDTEEIAVALQRLLTDDALHAELREKGLQRARTFSWEKAARRTLEIYRQVVQARTLPAPQPAAQSAPQPAAKGTQSEI
jgi:glycosyltransferase involved in cell wall biosynthesis